MELQTFILYTLDIIGTAVFAMSGVLIASGRKYDIFGAFVVAFVTALGGGTLRDILLGRLPVGWIADTTYMYIIMVSCLLAWMFKPVLYKLSKTLFLFDAIGLGVFTILGVQKCVEMNLPPIVCVSMGVISAVFGGVVRDVLCNQTPLIFRKEIYAMPCFVGGVLYVSGYYLDINLSIVSLVSASVVIAIRLLAVRLQWTLPKI